MASAFAVLIPRHVHAAANRDPWYVPDNVRVVQASPTDNVKTFATITAALNSITTASDTNRFVVKVMPGTYAETVDLKPYVALVGSGPDTTVLTTAPSSGSWYTVSAGNETRIENLTITYGGTAQAYDVYVQPNAHVVIENTKIVMPNAIYAWALRSSDPATIEMSHVHVLLAAGAQTSGDVAVMVGGGALTIRDSHFEINSATGNGFVTVYSGGGTKTEIFETRFDLAASAGVMELLDGDGWLAPAKLHRCTASVYEPQAVGGSYPLRGVFDIHSSTISATNYQYAAMLDGPSMIHSSTLVGGLYANGYDVRVLNSIVGSDSSGIVLYPNATIHAANSQLIGPLTAQTGSRITNCVDGNFDPIPPL